MRAENADQSSTLEVVGVIGDSKKPKFSYTRETLLSLSQLDICKKLPAGLDTAIPSEFEEASNNVRERPRIPGSLFSQHFRRGDQGSSPPTRGDTGNYNRGVHGKWDSCSSGLNDRDGDSQLDWDSDFGRRYGNQSRRSWQNSEHDGLLGSGGFPRPSGYTAGASTAKGRGNSHYQLNKSNEPYHPPRPYKAVPHSRRDTTDMHNDETFGSSECSSEDRAEEERRRRASFELFRKEQKEKVFSDKQKENVEPDVLASLVDSEENKKSWDENNGSELRTTILQTDSTKCAMPAQTPASRPLVPPGFTGTIMDKSLGTKSGTPQPVAEVGSIVHDNISHGGGNPATNGFSGNHEKKPALLVDSSEQQCEIKTVHIPVTHASEKLAIQPSDRKPSGDSTADTAPHKGFNPPEAYEGPGDTLITGFNAEKILGNGKTNTTSQEQEHSTSILEKLFGSVPPITSYSSDLIEYGDIKADDMDGHIPFKSSKFTHWFLEEDNKLEDEPSPDEPKDLLSLIVSGEKSGLQVSGLSEKEPPIFPSKGNELMNKFATSTTISATEGTNEPFFHYNNPDPTPGVLTCEDLELSILSGISENKAIPQDSIEDGGVSDAKAEDSVALIDSQASQHLLSLLRKGTTMKDSSSHLESFSSDHSAYEGGIISSAFKNSNEENTGRVASEKSLTLETLFGSAFMEELQSVEAPLSVQRGSNNGSTKTDVSKSQGFLFPASNVGVFPQSGSEYGSNKTSLENDTQDSSCTQQPKSNQLERNWLRLDASQSGVRLDLKSVDGIEDKTDRALEIRLPEEESLFSVVDPQALRHSIAMPVSNVTNPDVLLSSSGTPVDIVDKLAALNAALKHERSMCPNVEGPPFLSGPHLMEPNPQGWQSSPQFAHLQQQMSQWRPPFQPLEPRHAHMNPQMKFMGSENIFQHEVRPQHHFPANINLPQSFQNASVGPSRFDSSGHHPMLQQMHLPGSLPPPHQMLQGVPRGAPMPPPQSISHMGGYAPEPNPMHGFPLGQRQRSFSGHEMPIPGVGGGNNHPEALEKLFEMQLGANMKQQMHQVAGGAYNQQQGSTHSHGIDLGFRYR